MQSRDTYIYYSDDMIGAERVKGFSSFTKITGDIFLGREPSYLDIKQTTLGDCYLLSVLKTIVRRNPQIIHDIIKEKKGRIHVRLYYPAEVKGTFSEQWYAIDKSIVSHLINKIGQGHQAPWVYLLEKAYALHRLRDPKFLMKKRRGDKELKIESAQNLDFHEIISSGHSNTVFMDLVGVQASGFEIPQQNHSLVFLLRSNHEALFDTKSVQNLEIISRLFKRDESLLLYYSSLLMKLTFTKNEFILFQKEAHLLANKIEAGDATQAEILKFFLGHFKNINKEFYNAIKLAVHQGIGVQLGDKRYSTEAIEIYHMIHEKIKNGELLTLASKDVFPEKHNSEGLISGHAYEVLNCYQRSGHCYIVISNPWQRISRGYEVEGDSSKFSPKVHDKGFFKNPNSNTHSLNHLHDIAICNEDYHPSKTLSESGTFELELNDCMNFFHVISFTKIDATIKKCINVHNELNDQVSFIQKEIDRMSQGDSQEEINVQAPKFIGKISQLRTEQDRIMKLVSDLNQLKENVNPKVNITPKK